MQGVPLAAISKRLNKFSWQLLEILYEQPELAKKDLFEKLGEKSRRKFEIEYAKIYGASLVEEKPHDYDGRSFQVYLTEEGKSILSLKNQIHNELGGN
ncbi:hypothetical protein [Cytobacillus pseudoceanisediminis]